MESPSWCDIATLRGVRCCVIELAGSAWREPGCGDCISSLPNIEAQVQLKLAAACMNSCQSPSKTRTPWNNAWPSSPPQHMLALDASRHSNAPVPSPVHVSSLIYIMLMLMPGAWAVQTEMAGAPDTAAILDALNPTRTSARARQDQTERRIREEARLLSGHTGPAGRHPRSPDL